MADNRIAYGLAKRHGINTTGMTPREVWEALKNNGVDAESEIEKQHNKQRESIKKYSSEPDRDMKNAGLTKEGIGDKLKLPNEYFPKGVGAKVNNVDIKLPNGQVVHIKEGTYIKNKEVFAGQGIRKEIRDVDRLVDKYGGEKKDWRKVKGTATLEYKIDGKNEEIEAEIHWYEALNIGKVEVKIKAK